MEADSIITLESELGKYLRIKSVKHGVCVPLHCSCI